MKATEHVRSVAALAVGGGLTAALWWGLLNVPESNVAALILSTTLAVLVVVCAGVTTGLAAAFGQGLSSGQASRRALAACPLFVASLAVFMALWWLTGTADGWWREHQGEVDALFLRYPGITQTQWLHRAMVWAIWLVRWGLGLSVVLAITVVATLRSNRFALAGLRLSVRWRLLAATAVGLLVVTQLLWRLAYWRPAALPANWIEVLFAVVKLGALSLLSLAIAAAVLRIYGRAAASV